MGCPGSKLAGNAVYVGIYAYLHDTLAMKRPHEALSVYTVSRFFAHEFLKSIKQLAQCSWQAFTNSSTYFV